MNLQYSLFILFISVQLGFSQTHIYKHFGVDEGLPSAEVYDVYQDKLGYVWFATDKGISRYNGYEFKNFTTKDGLPDNTILDFYPQENGQIWCYGYHSQSLFYFDEVFNNFKTYQYNDVLKNELDTKSVVKSIVVDKDNNLHIGGYGIYGLIKINQNGKASVRYDKGSRTNSASLSQNVYLGFETKKKSFFRTCYEYQSEDDTVIFNSNLSSTTRLDFAFLNDEQTVFIDSKLGLASINGDMHYYDTQQNPIGLKRINSHLFFVGYYANGAEIRDVSGSIIETFLPNKSVSNFLIDTEGSYWFSTIDDGVYYIKNPKIQIHTKDHISSLVKDHANTLYAGYNNGDIVHFLQDKTEILYKGLNNNDALVAFDTTNKELYGHSDHSLINYTNPKIKFNVGASSIPEHIGENLLSSMYIHFYKKEGDNIKTYKAANKIQDICNYNGNTLLATSAGLFIQKNDSITKYQPNPILKHRIDDIDLNKNTNTLYMATQGAGVIVYGDSIYNITKENGLTNNIVREVHIENDSVVWACTNTGLNRIVFKPNNTNNLTTLTKADGLLSNDINDIEIINDTVWVATKKGLCHFKKEVLEEKTAARVLSLSLNEVLVNNVSVTEKNIKLKYNQNHLNFKLQAISHKNSSKIEYLYRLKEVDTTWAKTNNRNIQFPSLSPGNYTFEAKAIILDNQNELHTNYSFKILPPFWKSWWFYTSCSLLVIGLIYLFFKIRVLTYNKDIIRELIRLSIKRLKRNEQFYNFRANGEDFKIPTYKIQYVKSQGNYLDITTSEKTYTIRCKIGDFISTTPDTLEYVRVHRSYVIRIDQISSKGKNWVVINSQKIPVGETYLSQLEKIQF